MTAQHIGIAGAGLLGRLLAWRLAGLGHAVTVFDPAGGLLARGHAAGWTAAGMLSPWAELECADDVAVLLRGDAELALQLRREHAERVAREIVQDRAETDERDDPPAQVPYADHAGQPGDLTSPRAGRSRMAALLF